MGRDELGAEEPDDGMWLPNATCLRGVAATDGSNDDGTFRPPLSASRSNTSSPPVVAVLDFFQISCLESLLCRLFGCCQVPADDIENDILLLLLPLQAICLQLATRHHRGRPASSSRCRQIHIFLNYRSRRRTC